MAVREIAAGAIITVVIGGGAYTINQADVVSNFASDTGMSQQEAQKYVSDVKDEDLVSYDKLGTTLISDGNDVLSSTQQIDCVNYEYDWESPTLTCEQGKIQLTELGNSEVALGHAYKKLGSDSASRDDIANTVVLID